MALIEVENFSYTYPGEREPTLRNVSFSLKRGSFTVLTGKSGNGKSTLGKALAGFVFQDEKPNYQGTITANSANMSSIPLYEASERVAYVQQNPENQFCTLSVADEIAFGLENKKVEPFEINRRIKEALEIVQGENLRDRDLATLSGGEKQKIAIASMLVLSPDVLILDEPTSNLDPVATQNIFEALFHLRKTQNLTVIIIEHKLAQLRSLKPDLILLDDGKVSPVKTITAFQTQLKKVEQSLLPLVTSHLSGKETLIDVKNLSVNLDGKVILNDINMNFGSGQFIALMGPNGSGKSTLLNTIMGLIKPRTGKIHGFDRELTRERTSSLVRKMGYVFQNPDHQLFSNVVIDEATLILKNFDMLTSEAISQAHLWLKQMHLEHKVDDHPQRLSYGEKRRLNLLAVILHRPKILLIDEFLIGQDRSNASHWMHFFREYANQGNCVVLVNHHMELTNLFCDRIIFLDEGKVRVDQPTKEAIPSIQALGYKDFFPKWNDEYAYA